MLENPYCVDPLVASLRQDLIDRALVSSKTRWTRLAGGRTNLVWWLHEPGTPLICKLSLPQQSTPLFPNLPDDERRVLQHLTDTGLAPRLLASWNSEYGACLVYRACLGPIWREDAEQVGRLLARLHGQKPPSGLRIVSITPANLLRQGENLLAGIETDFGLPKLRPKAYAAPPAPLVFLHGDPVPGNIVMAAGGPVLIDWQCPGVGDALHDLAIFLSPAMQILGRGTPLTKSERAAFFTGYGNPKVIDRWCEAEFLLSWRMACYCAWRLTHGQGDYGPALTGELEYLHQLR